MSAEHLSDLTADEVAMLGYALRVVPGNACLTSGPLVEGRGLAFFTELPAWESLWEKVAEAIRERDDLAPFRSKPVEPGRVL